MNTISNKRYCKTVPLSVPITNIMEKIRERETIRVARENERKRIAGTVRQHANLYSGQTKDLLLGLADKVDGSE